jgi:hypothetical protein
MFCNELEDVKLCYLTEFRTQEDIMANVVDPRNQVFKRNKGCVTQQFELSGTFGDVSALKKRKRHVGRNSFGGLWILYQNSTPDSGYCPEQKTLVTQAEGRRDLEPSVVSEAFAQMR